MGNRPTLVDVAKAAGVHLSTASRALNDSTSTQISPETVKKVQKVAKELGYTINTVARGLRTKKTQTIGVIVPDLTNPIFPPIVRGIDSYLGPRGYSVLVVNTDNDAESERNHFNSLMRRQVDGLIIATGHTDQSIIADYHNQGITAVMVNREATGAPYPAVIGDDASGISMGVEHLASLGHKKLLHLTGPTESSTSRIRSQAFTAACKKLGLQAKIIKCSAYSIEAGQNAMDKFLDQNPKAITGVVAGNDLLALGVYHSLRSHGLKCPQDVSVVGFNNMPFANDFQPPLTTVDAPHYEMGVQAARIILNQIEGDESSPVKIMLPVSLIVRGSTATAKKL
jgi:LacI family transcriptional regulator